MDSTNIKIINQDKFGQVEFKNLNQMLVHLVMVMNCPAEMIMKFVDDRLSHIVELKHARKNTGADTRKN